MKNGFLRNCLKDQSQEVLSEKKPVIFTWNIWGMRYMRCIALTFTTILVCKWYKATVFTIKITTSMVIAIITVSISLEVKVTILWCCGRRYFRKKTCFKIATNNTIEIFFLLLKGQLISKCLFGAIVSTKKNKEIFLRISALASRKRLNQNLYHTNYVK